MHEVDDQSRMLRWSSAFRSALELRPMPDAVELPRQRVPLVPPPQPASR